MTWQPIETAPRDGRQILLWDGRDMVCGEFVTWPDGSAWWEVAKTATGILFLERGATHWMSLPEPPQ